MVRHGLKHIFQKPTPDIDSSDRTQQLRSKTIYAGTVNLAQTLAQGSNQKYKTYNGPYEVAAHNLIASHSYDDLLSITKGKVLLNQLPLNSNSNAYYQQNFASGQMYEGNYNQFDPSHNFVGHTGCNNSVLVYDIGTTGFTGPASYHTNGGFIGATGSQDNNKRIFIDPNHCYYSNPCLLDASYTKFVGPVLPGTTGPGQFNAQQIISADQFRGFSYPMSNFNLTCEQQILNQAIGPLFCPLEPPENTAHPVILGNSLVGSVLTVDSNGTWSNTPTSFTYQWYSGATLIPSQTTTSYTTQQTDIGLAITCQVVAINAGGSSAPATSNLIVVVPPPPVNTAHPVILGNSLVGSVLTVDSNGTWSNTPTSFTYQWYSGATLIPSQTTTSYTTQQTDIGLAITCQVVAINAGGSSAPATSNSTVVVPPPPVNTAPPVISVSQLVGSVLSVSNGTWSNTPTSFTYQWYSGATLIPSQTTTSYTTQQTDIGLAITCQVVAINAGGSSAPATSNSTVVVPPSIVAVGNGMNSIVYSLDGMTWLPSLNGNTITTYALGVAWNGTDLWVAVGDGLTTIANSSNGVTWLPSSNGGLNSGGSGVAWNGTDRWVAVGGGLSDTIATSTNGISWTGLSNLIFSSGYGVAWNGLLWVAVGYGANTIATSPNGTIWTGLGNSIFTVNAANDGGRGVAWSSSLSLWVAVGVGITNTIATSTNGTSWTGLGTSIFTIGGNGVAWNGTDRWVAVGSGMNSIATSSNGTSWTGLGTSIFTIGKGVAWNSSLSKWVAVGSGANSIATSSDGINWFPSSSGNSIINSGNGVASK